MSPTRFPEAGKCTDFLVQGSFCLDVVFLEFIVKFFKSFQVFDSDAHLLDFLSRNKPKISIRMEGGRDNYLAKHQVPLSQLDEHLLGTKRIVKLEFEIFDLLFGVLEHNEDGLVRV